MCRNLGFGLYDLDEFRAGHRLYLGTAMLRGQKSPAKRGSDTF
jgi:hypothetical protein